MPCRCMLRASTNIFRSFRPITGGWLPLGWQEPQVGFVCAFVKPATLRKVPSFDLVEMANMAIDLGPIEGGEAMVKEASKGFAEALRSGKGLRGWLALAIAQCLEPANAGLIMLGAWRMRSALARVPLEIMCGPVVNCALEKTVLDAYVRATGDATLIKSVMQHDRAVKVVGFECKVSGTEGVNSIGKKEGHVFGFSRAFERITDTKAPTTFWILEPAADGTFKCQAIVASARALLELIRTGRLFTGGNDIPKVKSDPRHLKEFEWDKITRKKTRIPRFPKTETQPFIREDPSSKGSNGAVFRRDISGAYQTLFKNGPEGLKEFHWNDLVRCAQHDSVDEVVLIENGDGRAVVDAVRRFGARTATTACALNLQTTVAGMRVHNWAVMKVSAVLAKYGIVVAGDVFSEDKQHILMKLFKALMAFDLCLRDCQQEGCLFPI